MFLQPPRPDAHCGLLFIEVSGCLPICGRGTIGVAIVAFGGNFYAITPLTELGLEFRADRSNKDDLLHAGLAIMAAINEADPPVHPQRPDIRSCHHVYLQSPDSTPPPLPARDGHPPRPV